jgi:hypothetical protein
MGGSAAISLSLLCLGPKRKVKCYNEYFVNGYVFHTEEYGHGRKTYNNGVCIKGSTSSEFEVDYYGRLKEVIEMQYHSEQNRVFLFKCYWYDTTDRGIRVDPHYGLVEINSKARHRNVNNLYFCKAMPTSLLHIHPFL